MLILSEERPHPGAQLSFTDVDGKRLTGFVTNTTRGGPAQHTDLELRHRRDARCEDRIRAAKDTGLRSLPLHDFDQNRIWTALVMLAGDLIAWCALLALTVTAATNGWTSTSRRHSCPSTTWETSVSPIGRTCGCTRPSGRWNGTGSGEKHGRCVGNATASLPRPQRSRFPTVALYPLRGRLAAGIHWYATGGRGYQGQGREVPAAAARTRRRSLGGARSANAPPSCRPGSRPWPARNRSGPSGSQESVSPARQGMDSKSTTCANS